MSLNNDAAVRAFMLRVSEEVIEKVSKDILKKLRENIMRYTYHGDNAFYDPTYQFLNSFVWDGFKRDVKTVIKNLYYDYHDMTYRGDLWIHGSDIAGWGDAREYLADILNYDGIRGTGKMNMTRAVKPYWKITMEELLDKGKIEKWITKELKILGSKYGFKVIKI